MFMFIIFLFYLYPRSLGSYMFAVFNWISNILLLSYV